MLRVFEIKIAAVRKIGAVLVAGVLAFGLTGPGFSADSVSDVSYQTFPIDPLALGDYSFSNDTSYSVSDGGILSAAGSKSDNWEFSIGLPSSLGVSTSFSSFSAASIFTPSQTPLSLSVYTGGIWNVLANVPGSAFSVPEANLSVSVFTSLYPDPIQYRLSLFTEKGPSAGVYRDNIDIAAVTPVPVPEFYAMMGLGLGMMGWIGRRQRQQVA